MRVVVWVVDSGAAPRGRLSRVGPISHGPVLLGAETGEEALDGVGGDETRPADLYRFQLPGLDQGEDPGAADREEGWQVLDLVGVGVSVHRGFLP
jgi:hypothetical protein